MDKREKIAILLDENALIIESINDITSILKEVANIKENCIQIEIRLNGTLEKLSNLANINRDKILALHTEIDKLQREIEETGREVFGPKFLSGFGKKEKPEIDLFKVVEDEKIMAKMQDESKKIADKTKEEILAAYTELEIKNERLQHRIEFYEKLTDELLEICKTLREKVGNSKCLQE